MSTVEYGGVTFRVRRLPSTAAQYVAALNTRDAEEQLSACFDIVVAAGLDWEAVQEAAFNADNDILDLVGDILEVWSARPWKSSVMLAVVAVKQWHTIRGRLIDKGIGDPLGEIPSLEALLDVIEVMLMDGAKDDDDRARLQRELYPSPVGKAPPGDWSDEALLDAFPSM